MLKLVWFILIDEINFPFYFCVEMINLELKTKIKISKLYFHSFTNLTPLILFLSHVHATSPTSFVNSPPILTFIPLTIFLHQISHKIKWKTPHMITQSSLTFTQFTYQFTHSYANKLSHVSSTCFSKNLT